MTTIDTLTDTQIETLRDEAAAAGDLAQVALCRLALGYALNELSPLELDAVSCVDVARAEARIRCLRAIQSAEAQS
jgi:hypothetical protein